MMRYRKLGRKSGHRQLMIRNMVTSLLKHGKIQTTETRAKEAQRAVEKMITIAKRGDLHARRLVLSFVTEETVVKTLFDEIAPKYKETNGGYTRIYKLGPRLGDATPMALIELK